MHSRLNKPIIPLLVEKNYKADGWLGIFCGAKLWIEFTDKELFKNGMSRLIKEIGDRGKIGNGMIGANDDVVDYGGKKCIYHLLFL